VDLSGDGENVATINEESPQSDKQNETRDDHHHRSHGKNLNMYGVFIHVLGDALGNVGVVATGLFIHFTKFSWRFYSDPLIR
jgi:solute carrier family 30 (zinc transporter), member 1